MDNITLQELISRGRFLFSGAPKRLELFKLIDGKLTAKEFAIKTGRSHSSVCQDIAKLRDFGLILEKNEKISKDRGVVYEKTPLAKHISHTYFESVSNTTVLSKKDNSSKKIRTSARNKIHIPSEREILDICKHGEDQLYEFKSPGTSADKITKEIAAFLHTKNGGILFHGIDDDGTIIGSDLTRQQLDQKIQNSVRNTISPQPNIDFKGKDVMGSKIIMVIIPPWDRKSLYQYTKNDRYLIRKGTNIFAIKPDELAKLSKGEYVI